MSQTRGRQIENDGTSTNPDGRASRKGVVDFGEEEPPEQRRTTIQNSRSRGWSVGGFADQKSFNLFWSFLNFILVLYLFFAIS